MEKALGVGGLATSEQELVSSEFKLLASANNPPAEIVRTIPIEVRPHATGGQNNIPYTFEIAPDPDKWTNLKSFRLHGRVRIQNKTKNADPASTEDWSVVNNFYQSLISKVIVKINGTEISDASSNPYPYKAYIETLLNYTKQFKTTVLKSAHWMEDIPGKTGRTITKTDTGFNQGYLDRREGLSGGGYNEFVILLHSDVITCEKHLPPGYGIEISIQRMDDSFCIINGSSNTENEYKIELDNISLSCDRYETREKISRNGIIPFTRNYIKVYPKQQGETHLGTYNILSGEQLPEAVYIAMIDQDAYNGSTTTNPFYFKNIELNEASLIVNSFNEPPQPYTNTIESKKKMDLYHEFLKNTGMNQFDSQSVSVTYDMYYNGYFMLAWDRTGSKDNRFRRSSIDGGSMSINLKAKDPLENNIVVLVYVTYSSAIELRGDDVITRTF